MRIEMLGKTRMFARLWPSLVLSLALAIPAGASQPDKNVRFQRISVGDGLSQAAVTTIMQDRRGFMWFGTQEGLNRFDGTDFIAFQHDPADSTTLSHDSVRAVVEDEDGALWVGTDNGGLARFDESTQTFTHFRHDPNDANSIGSDRLRAIYRDRDGVLWLGTDGGGLSRFEPTTQSFENFLPDPEDPFSLSHEHVRAVLRDSAGRLWVGTDGGGLNLLEPGSTRFLRFQHDPSNDASIGGNHVYSIFETRDGSLWVGTADGGLNQLDPNTFAFRRYQHRPGDPTSISAGTVRAVLEDRNGLLLVGTDMGLHEWNPGTESFKIYQHDDADPFSLSDNRIDTIFQDRGGVIWLGTRVGINKWNPSTGSFPHYKAKSEDPKELSNDYITSFAESPDGAVWIGTLGGLNRFDRAKQSFERFLHDPAKSGSLAENRIGSLMVDREGGLWVGTVRSGVDYLAPSARRFENFRNSAQDPSSLSFNGVTSLLQDRAGTIWVGTYRGGLNRFDPESGGFTHYRHDSTDPSSLSSDRVVVVFEDSAGTLWVGTDGGGLNRMDREGGTFVSYVNDPEDPSSLSSDHIWTISESAGGDLYLGTQGGGLNRWKAIERAAERAVFQRFLKKDGLLSSVVYGMLWDESEQLWISSNRGLTVFTPATGIFRNYNTSHGLQSEEFNSGAALRTEDGQMFFGGINGFNAFRPQNIRTNEHVPPVVLTGILKLNQRAKFDRPLTDLEEIELGYKDTMVTFDFAALDYTAPEKNRYRYVLEGFDRGWVDLESRNRAIYTNLDAGDYVFRVQGSNNDGVWNQEGFSIRVRVLPPPWATWWAYAGYAAAACLLGLYYFQGQMKKRLRTLELARANDSLEREIARRHAKEQALFREKAKAQEYFQVAEVIMLVLDNDGHVVLINNKGTEVLGYDESELIGKNWFDTVVVEPFHIRDRFFKGRASECSEYAVVTRSGERRVIAWQSTYLTNHDGSPAGILSSGSDVTEIKRLQEEKESAESASRAKSQFLANMSHEIRTPMNGVLGMLELLMSTDLDEKQANCAQKARLSAVNLLGILNEILDFSKIEAGKVELEDVNFDLRDLVDEVISLFAESARVKGLQLRTTLPRGLPTAVRADPTRLRQVLINLVGNAVKFTDSGYVELEISALEENEDEVRYGFAVEDTGIGIAREDCAAVFESFQQADGTTTRTYGGTGLGLAISKAFVEMMGGQIGVHSTLGEGSTFWFHLGLARRAATPESSLEPLKSTAEIDVKLGGRRILLVEDNVVNQEVATGMLQEVGALVDVAGNGLEALDALEEGHYDLVLMDCQMPEMDGYTATRELRRLEQKSRAHRKGRLPVVAMTAHAMAGERNKCIEAGMDDYLSKPFSQEQLKCLVGKWLPSPHEPPKRLPDRRDRSSPGARLRALPQPLDAELPCISSGEARFSDPPPINDVLQQKYLWGSLSRAGAERVIRVYLETTPELLQGMGETVESGDLAALAELAHRLKSSSAMLGANHLAELCGWIEEQARAESQRAFGLVTVVRGEFERVATALEELEPRAEVS